MIGYHFTTAENWQKIRVEGLVPYKLPRHQAGLASVLAVEGYHKVIWLWPEVPAGADLVGCIIDRVTAKHDTRLVLLAVRYEPDEMIAGTRDGRCRWSLNHDGSIGHPCRDDEWVYHKRVPFVLLRDQVPPERIRVVGDFDLVKLLENNLTPELMDAEGERSESREVVAVAVAPAQSILDKLTDDLIWTYGLEPGSAGLIPKSVMQDAQ